MVQSDTLIFYTSLGSMGKALWVFTFTTDIMTGGVTNQDTTYYLGPDSNANASHLTRA